jgi:inhibitor of KinA
MGNRGIVIRFEQQPSDELTSHLAGLAKTLRELDGVVDAAPGHQTVLVEGPLRRMKEIPKELSRVFSEMKPYQGQVRDVPIDYVGEDLAWVCKHSSLSKSQFIEIHSGRTYQVRLIGSPGFIYLSEVDARIEAPRLEVPRQQVLEGAVGIGGRQTGIYGRTRPGGWRLVGSVTEIPEVTPGDRIRFLPQ